MDLRLLADAELMERSRLVCANARQADAALVTYLGEIEERRLHLREGYSSIFDYCVRGLGLSEGAAFRRMHAARLVLRFPILKSHIEKGSLHLSGLVLLRDHFDESNVETLVARAAGKTKREVEELVAEIAPRPDVPGKLRKLPVHGEAAGGFVNAGVPAVLKPLSEARYMLRLTVSGTLRDKIERARAMMRHRNPSGELAVVMEHAIDALLRELSRERMAETTRPRRGGGKPKRESIVETGKSDFDGSPAGGADAARVVTSEVDLASIAADVGSSAFAALDALDARATAGVGGASGVAGGGDGEIRAGVGGATAGVAGGGDGEIRAGVGGATAGVAGAGEEEVDAGVGGATAGIAGARDGELRAGVGAVVRDSSRVPHAVIRAVYERDGEQCTYESADGRRCNSRAFLELDHIIPRALGGPSTVENLRVLCRAHNQFAAEQSFGRERVAERIRLRQRKSEPNLAANEEASPTERDLSAPPGPSNFRQRKSNIVVPSLAEEGEALQPSAPAVSEAAALLQRKSERPLEGADFLQRKSERSLEGADFLQRKSERSLEGADFLQRKSDRSVAHAETDHSAEAIRGLVGLGFRDREVRRVIDEVEAAHPDVPLSVVSMIRAALRRLTS